MPDYSKCADFTLTLWNGTFVTDRDASIAGLFGGPNINMDASIASLYCAGSRDGICLGICPNADLAGPGVRISFYLQSFTNTVLIALSHSDSAEGAWTATILTAAIVIPAMIQKSEVSLTLYHATLILNFATFSTVASLATAPLCWMWNTAALADKIKEKENQWRSQPLSQQEQNRAFQRAREKGKRSRIVLSVALIIQIALQWAWAIMLFTRPVYDQKTCSAGTTVFLFGKPFLAGDINSKPGWIWIWVGWVFFCIFVTFFWGVLLVFHSSRSARATAPSATSPQEGMIGRWVNRVAAGAICLLLLICSELQVTSNCVLGNESGDWGFGQITALLLAASPIWGIVVAARKKFSHHEKESEDTSSLAHTGSIRHRIGRSSTLASRRRSARNSMNFPGAGIPSMAQVNINTSGLRNRHRPEQGHTRAFSSSDAGRPLLQPSPQLSSFDPRVVSPPSPFPSAPDFGAPYDSRVSFNRAGSSSSYFPTTPTGPGNGQGLMLTADYGIMGSSAVPGRQYLAATYTSSHVGSDDQRSFDNGAEPSSSSVRTQELSPYASAGGSANLSVAEQSKRPRGLRSPSLTGRPYGPGHTGSPITPVVEIELQAASEDSHDHAGPWASMASLPTSDAHVQPPPAATIRSWSPTTIVSRHLLDASTSSTMSIIPPLHPSVPPDRYVPPSPPSAGQPSPTLLSPEYGTHRRRPSNELGHIARVAQPSYDLDPFGSPPRSSLMANLQLHPPLSPARLVGPGQQAPPSPRRVPGSPPDRISSSSS